MNCKVCGTSLLQPNVRGKTPEFSRLLEYHERNLVNLITFRFQLETWESSITKNDIDTFSVTGGGYCI